MKQRKRKRRGRRRQGRFSFLYRLISFVLIVAVIVAALTLFFRVDAVEVEGNRHYTAKQIEETTGIQNGDNLILLNKMRIRTALLEKLPYIDEVSIHRQLPDTLVIQVTECAMTLGIAQGGVLWLISPSGKIVAREKDASKDNSPRIDGCTLLSPSIGSTIAMASSFAARQDSLLTLLSALSEAELLDQLQGIHLGDSAMLTMDYGGRFLVELPYNANYDQKLKSLSAVIEKLESNETGRINLRQDAKANFIPS